MVRDNWYTHSDLRNGQTGTIASIHADNRTLTLRRDLDGAVIELPGSYVDSSVDHAYAQTIHTAQGQTFHTAHLYVDTGISAEHGYTGLSRARVETHLWVNTRRTISGSCLRPSAHPAPESTVDILARQLSRTVVSQPAVFQGVAVAVATDRQLHEWETQLAETIHTSPVGTPIRVENLAYLEEAIIQIAESGAPWAQAEIERLEGSRQKILDQITQRDQWVENHGDLLHAYTAINDELTARATALAIGYQLNTPDDVLETLGPRPTNTTRAREWDEAVIHHAAARIRLGPDTDLTDPAVLTAASWQTALRSYHPQLELERVPTLRLTG